MTHHIPGGGVQHVKAPVTELSGRFTWHADPLSAAVELDPRDHDGTLCGVAFTPPTTFAVSPRGPAARSSDRRVRPLRSHASIEAQTERKPA
jgi:hypothetical protein